MDVSQIQSLSNEQLIQRVSYLVRRERELVESLIWHLQEIQDRKLFIPMGYTSLYECLVKHFKYSEATAYARISALKIITSTPAAAELLEKGEVTVTTLSLAQSFIRQQEKQTGLQFSAEQKTHLVEEIKNKTTREAKEALAALSPIAELPFDSIQFLDASHAQMKIVVDKALLEKIEKLKNLISHEEIQPTYNDLLHRALDAAIEMVERRKGWKTAAKSLVAKIERHDFLKNEGEIAKGSDTETKTKTENAGEIQSRETQRKNEEINSEKKTRSFSIKSSRLVSNKIKRVILKRSEGKCEFKHSDGRTCGSTFQIQFDHIQPHSKGGISREDNIQTLCRVHNAYKGCS